jgi:hypothetical protein
MRRRSTEEIAPIEHSGTDEREAWLNAFAEQLTTPMIRAVEVYARTLVRWSAREGAIVGDLAARELVQDALSDVFEGKVRWDRSEALALRLKNIVRWRARDLRNGFAATHALNRADIGEDLENGKLGDLATEASTYDPFVVEEHSTPSMCAHRLAAMQDLAGEDREVVAMIAAIINGAVTRRDLKEALALSDVGYQRVRARFDRVAAAMRARGEQPRGA